MDLRTVRRRAAAATAHSGGAGGGNVPGGLVTGGAAAALAIQAVTERERAHSTDEAPFTFRGYWLRGLNFKLCLVQENFDVY